MILRKAYYPPVALPDRLQSVPSDDLGENNGGMMQMQSTDYYADLADQRLGRADQSNEPAEVDHSLASAQVNAILAVAAALDRLAGAIEARD